MIGVAERRYLLPADVETVPVSAEEVSIGRPSSRAPAQLVSTEAADLLAQFGTPVRLADALIAHCAVTGADPVTTLDEAFGVLIAVTRSGVLVPDGSDEADPATARRQAGDRVGPAVVHSPIRLVRDTEIWRGRLDDGRWVIVKTVDQRGLGPDLFARDPVHLVAECSDARGRREIAVAVVAAYADLHRHGVLHGDVHPGNILLDADLRVQLIDFGLAAVTGLPPAPRPAGGECLDSQSAAALLAERPLPVLDAAAEQYAVAALAFRLITGRAYLDLEIERPDALRSIVQTPPRRFAAVAGRWAAGERVLRRALAKRPTDRFRSVEAFAEALRRHCGGPHRCRPDTRICPAYSPSSTSPERSGPKPTMRKPRTRPGCWAGSRR
jgi:serine/threonine-protein kinase